MGAKLCNQLKREFLPDRCKKNVSIDWRLELLKAIASFLVVFYHFAIYRMDFGFIPGNRYLPTIGRIVMCFASCSVPIFFWVNGALMLKKERKIGAVYYKAFKVVVLILIWKWASFPSWFFRTLAIIYLLFPAMQFLWMKKRKVYYLIMVGIFVYPFVWNFVVTGIHILVATGGHFEALLMGGHIKITGFYTMYSLLYFMLGPVLYTYLPQKASVGLGFSFIILGWAFVTVECTAFTNVYQSMYDGVNSAFPTIGALLLTIGVVATVMKMKIDFLDFEVAKFIKEGILGVYLLHGFLISIFRMLVPEYTLNAGMALLGSCVIFAACFLLTQKTIPFPISPDIGSCKAWSINVFTNILFVSSEKNVFSKSRAK